MEFNFAEQLLKGRIAETIFEQMFLETKKFNVYSFGFEKTLPQIAQYHHNKDVSRILQQIKSFPDFILAAREHDGVYLTEVEYREHLDPMEVHGLAEDIHSRWDYSWLFLATHEGFYFQSCWDVMNNGGNIASLGTEWVPKKVQEEFLSILNRHMKGK